MSNSPYVLRARRRVRIVHGTRSSAPQNQGRQSVAKPDRGSSRAPRRRLPACVPAELPFSHGIYPKSGRPHVSAKYRARERSVSSQSLRVTEDRVFRQLIRPLDRTHGDTRKPACAGPAATGHEHALATRFRIVGAFAGIRFLFIDRGSADCITYNTPVRRMQPGRACDAIHVESATHRQQPAMLSTFRQGRSRHRLLPRRNLRLGIDLLGRANRALDHAPHLC